MSVGVGTHLGSIEITGLLGRGGVGEVYRTCDVKLQRDVALKLLPLGQGAAQSRPRHR